MLRDPGSPPQVAADPRSSMGPQSVPGPGSYSGCQVTRSNSLPSGSAKVVWRTAATPGGSAAAGSVISWSGLAPRPVSRSVSSSWWSVTRTGWTLFLAVPGPGGMVEDHPGAGLGAGGVDRRVPGDRARADRAAEGLPPAVRQGGGIGAVDGQGCETQADGGGHGSSWCKRKVDVSTICSIG